MYTGRVQGVGFRQSVYSLTAGKCLHGYVQNLDNGKVKLVIEGEAREVDRLLEEVKKSWGHNIADVQMTDLDTTGTFSNFSVRY